MQISKKSLHKKKKSVGNQNDVNNIYLLHFYLVKRLEEVENRTDFVQCYHNAVKTEEIRIGLEKIRYFIQIIFVSLKNHITQSKQKLYIQFYLDFSKDRLICNDRHMIVSTVCNVHRILRCFRKILLYIFLLLMYYEAFVFDEQRILRHIFYLIQSLSSTHTDSLKDDRFYKIYTETNELIQIPPDLISKSVSKKMRATMVGPATILTKTGKLIDYNADYNLLHIRCISDKNAITIDDSVVAYYREQCCCRSINES